MRQWQSLEAIDAMATTLHRRHVDRSGQPYIEHCRAVARMTAENGGTLAQQMAALLHDSVEDVDVTLKELADLGVAPEVVTLVDAMSRRPDESQEDYLGRLVTTRDAILIKRADIAHNSSPERLDHLDEATQHRLRLKYAAATAILDAADPH
ncbi:HD domain-containing protein [Longispora sp. K20-0274]|uniref:HD domain-containing protein n=1 Tax=Longispora sp. K20-0274 TaxID=3088255 RepID=UPI00399A68B6